VLQTIHLIAAARALALIPFFGFAAVMVLVTVFDQIVSDVRR
jgi:hypothetical protein